MDFPVAVGKSIPEVARDEKEATEEVIELKLVAVDMFLVVE